MLHLNTKSADLLCNPWSGSNSTCFTPLQTVDDAIKQHKNDVDDVQKNITQDKFFFCHDLTLLAFSKKLRSHTPFLQSRKVTPNLMNMAPLHSVCIFSYQYCRFPLKLHKIQTIYGKMVLKYRELGGIGSFYQLYLNYFIYSLYKMRNNTAKIRYTNFSHV